MNRHLDVYLHNALVGTLEQTSAGDLHFQYAQQYLQTAKFGISLSMPLHATVYTGGVVRAFFSGLLPEEGVRERLAQYLGLSEKNPFALLAAVGGDCAGALALYPRGEEPSQEPDAFEVLDDKRLGEVLALIKRRPMLAGDEGYRLSLAGAQNKLAVGFQDSRVLLVKGGAPTTHILKPMIDHIADSAHNELFCMKLAKQVGIDVPGVSLHHAGDTAYYVVERYDRRVQSQGNVTRLHQEDFCQAMGIVPEMKYEREGGPGIAACQELILRCSARPAVNQIRFLDRIVFNFLIGNADAHGKNFSLLYQENGPELAPAYDLLSTAIYPDLAKNMAMKIGGKYKPQDVYLRHFYAHVMNTQAARGALERQIKKMTAKILDLASQLQSDLAADGWQSPVFSDIVRVIHARVKRLRGSF